jgi:hypothetical protein
MAIKKSKWLLVDGRPAPYEVAAQIKMVLNTARQTASSILRTVEVEFLLNPRGEHSQPQLYELSLHGTPAQRIAAGLPPGGGGVNRPGTSEHELKSDGVGKAGPVGRDLPRWQVGIDSGQNTVHDRAAIEAAGRKLGWRVRHHYGAGAERHHWCFDQPPGIPRGPRGAWTRARIAYWRRRLPSS